MLPFQTIVTSVTISWLCISVIEAQSLSQFILNMVSQPNMDPYTKNFLRTSVAQEMFDIEVPPPPPPPSSTPPPEGQFGRPGGEAAQWQGMVPSSEAMFNAPPSRGWNGGPNQLPRSETRRPPEAMLTWSENLQQQGSNFGPRSEQILVNQPYDAGNSQVFRDSYESPQSRYMSQRMPANWETYLTRQEMNMPPRTNEFYQPNNNQMEFGSSRNSNSQGTSRGNDLNQEYFYRNGQGNLPQNYQTQGNNQQSYPGNNPPNYQTQDSRPIPPNYQSSNAPNFQNQENAPANYQGQRNVQDNVASIHQKQDHSVRNAPVNNPERYQSNENNPSSFSNSRNIVNSQSNAIPDMLRTNAVSQEQLLTTTMAPLPNIMPYNNGIGEMHSRSEAVASSARQTLHPGRDGNAQENMSFQPNPARDNPTAYHIGNNNQRAGPVEMPKYPYGPANRFLPDLNSLPGPFMRNIQTQTGPGFPSQIPLGRNIFGRPYSNSLIPSDYYYRQPSTQSLGAFPLGFEGYSAMQATPPPPQLASFAARRMPSPQDMVKNGQVVVPRNVPSPHMMDQMMAMIGYEGVEVI